MTFITVIRAFEVQVHWHHENFMIAKWLKRAQNFGQIMKDSSSHKAVKVIKFLMDEGYPPHVYCHGIENLSFWLKIYVVRGMKRPSSIVLCEESRKCCSCSCCYCCCCCKDRDYVVCQTLMPVLHDIIIRYF